MKGLRWSSRNKRSEDRQKSTSSSTLSSNSVGTSSRSRSHRGGSTASNTSGSSTSRPSSISKSPSNLHLADAGSNSQRSISSSSSRHDLQTVNDNETLDFPSLQSSTLTAETRSHKEPNHEQLSTIKVTNEKYDHLIFKTGWLNRSHGISTSVQSAAQPSKNRESRLYSNTTISSNSTRNSSVYQQDYRLYKGQLRGCLLNFYKSGISDVKYFDPTLENTHQKENEILGNQPNNKDVISTPSASLMNDDPYSATLASFSSYASSTRNASDGELSTIGRSVSVGNTKRIKSLEFVSDQYPHPDLEFDKNGEIINGTVESLCHTILFATIDVKKILDLILMLPLLDDFNAFLEYFHLYSINMTKNAENLTAETSQYFKVDAKIDDLMTQRLAMVIKTVLDVFPGFLLDDDSFHLVIKILDGISLHDDEVSNTLKMPIAETHKKLNELVSFSKQPINNSTIMDYRDPNFFLQLDNEVIANQIHQIHLQFSKSWSPQSDFSILYDSKFKKQYANYNPLLFNNKVNVHYVSRLLIEQLFVIQKSGNPTSPKKRAEILTKWVQLGCSFEKRGDMVSWLAIATIICSIPILRLFSTWQYVSDQILKIMIKDWVPTIIQLERRQLSAKATNSVFILAPPNFNKEESSKNIIPYFGDLLIHTNDLTAETRFKYLEKKIHRTKNAFNKWDQGTATDDKAGKSVKNTFDQEENTFYHYWRYHLMQEKLSIENVMEMSLKIDPPKIDRLDQKVTPLKQTPMVSGSYLPILFNEPFPSFSLFSQSALLNALSIQQNPVSPVEKDTDELNHSEPLTLSKPSRLSTSISSLTGVCELDQPMIEKLTLNEANKSLWLDPIRDAFSINMDTFFVGNDLLFKYVGEYGENSRPVSLVAESTLDTEEISKLNMSGGGMEFFNKFSIGTKTLNNVLINVVLKSGSLDKLIDVLVLTPSVFSRMISIDDISAYFKHKYNSFDESKSIGLLDYPMIKLVMDNDLYTQAFLHTYKSFTNTSTLLENLAKRFIGAKACSVSISAMMQDNFERKKDDSRQSFSSIKFPCWDPDDSSFSTQHYRHAIMIQLGTAEALFYLIKHHYTDLNDDLLNNKLLLDIIKIMDQEIMEDWETRIKSFLNVEEDNQENTTVLEELRVLHSKLRDLLRKMKSTYQRQVYRPMTITKQNRQSVKLLETFEYRSMEKLNLLLNKTDSADPMISSFLDLKANSVEKIISWVYDLDKFFSNTLKLVTSKDWILFSQLVENLSCSSLDSLFHYGQLDERYSIFSSGNAQLDDIDIMNIFQWLKTLLDKDDKPFFNELPISIQLIINLHISLTDFFTVQISQLEKTYESRLDTCCVLLNILNFIRLKNKSLNVFTSLSNEKSNVSPHIPSFLESAIINAMISPESRKFEMCWKNAYESFNVHSKIRSIEDVLSLMDSSMELFLKFDATQPNKTKSLCPCPGWFMGRVLEISQLVPNVNIENPKLINFDKRRFIYNLVLNYQEYLRVEKQIDIALSETNYGHALFFFSVDPKKAFRSRAREVAIAETKFMKYQFRGVFNKILIEEMYKIKRDYKKKMGLLAQQAEELTSPSPQHPVKQKTIEMQAPLLSQVANHSSNSSVYSRSKRSSVMNSSRSSVISSVTPQSSGVGRKIGVFFRRPFSIGGFSSSSSNTAINSILVGPPSQNGSISPCDLPKITIDDFSEQKPVLSIRTFEIKKCMSAGTYSGDNNLIYCFKLIMESGQEYLLQASDAEEKNQWMKAITLSRRYSFKSKKFRGKTSNKVFGLPIEDLCERESTILPSIVEKLLDEIELRGLDEVGLYRVPGSVGSINALKNAFDEEGAINYSFTLGDDKWYEINTIAGCFKLYLRELPESPFTNQKLPEFLEIVQTLQSNIIENSEFERMIGEKLRSLPVCNYHMMKRIFDHLHKVHNHMESNRMDANNLAIVFSMSFINQDDLTSSMGKSLGLLQNLLQRLIKSPDSFFI